jgi:hypothetical protein
MSKLPALLLLLLLLLLLCFLSFLLLVSEEGTKDVHVICPHEQEQRRQQSGKAEREKL